ncbi:MAG TPA: hypothetical protein VFQ60_01485 [Patescibacteria group bacterium]|nr:hypothetical protein [Patescibacteria group bacterium]
MSKEMSGQAEHEPKIIVHAPASESLLSPTRADRWLEPIRQNPEFKAQVRERRTLCNRLDEVIAHLPSPEMDLETAVTEHILTEQQVANLYRSLTALLKNPDYRRLIFYLPFEFLPRKEWHPSSPNLKQKRAEFAAIYLARWHALLTIHDVRANFVDGDVLEVESRRGDLPRVVKAAHLIPILVEKGLLSLDDINELRRNTDDQLLKETIEETLPVLADLDFLPPQPEAIRPLAVAQAASITKKRTAWLAQEQRRRALDAKSSELAGAILHGSFDSSLLSASDSFTQYSAIDAVRKAMEQEAAQPSNALSLLQRYQTALADLWNAQPALHAPLSKLFYHAHALNLLTDRDLHQFGLPLPTLTGPFSKHLAEMKAPLTALKQVIAEIKRDPILAQYVYPIVLIFGSRVKGYGSKDADIDAAVLMKPDTDITQKPAIRRALRQAFALSHIDDSVVEFWLQSHGQELRVRNDAGDEPMIANRSWTHVLFNAVWEGDNEAIQIVRRQLLLPYVTEPNDQLFGRNLRQLCLEQFERDILQYRLMHNGYEKFYPIKKIKMPHAHLIDGQSAFWDSGYRQTATRLFAQHVFLPRLNKK